MSSVCYIVYSYPRSTQEVVPISSQSDIAYRQIKEMIFHLELLPGTRVPELQIAAKLSISRTPIHDALRRLAAEGLVVIGPHRGATVTCFSEAEIREIGAIRMFQDILAAQLAAYYGSASDFCLRGWTALPTPARRLPPGAMFTAASGWTSSSIWRSRRSRGTPTWSDSSTRSTSRSI